MKEKNESWLLSPHAAYHLELSIDFLHTRPVMDIGANEIPAELVADMDRARPERIADKNGRRLGRPNETMPYEVFARAHERHDPVVRRNAQNANFHSRRHGQPEFPTVPRRSCESSRDFREKADRGAPVRRVQLRQLPDHRTGRQEYAWKHGIPSV